MLLSLSFFIIIILFDINKIKRIHQQHIYTMRRIKEISSGRKKMTPDANSDLYMNKGGYEGKL
jgi:hypothetical protein